MPLDSGNLRLGGVHLDVGLDLSQLDQDLDSLGARLQRFAREAKVAVRPTLSAPSGGGPSGGSGVAPAAASLSGLSASLAGVSGQIAGAIDRGFAASLGAMARLGQELTRTFDAAIDRLKGIEKDTGVAAAYFKSSTLAAHDLFTAERGEFHLSHAERLAKRAQGDMASVTRRPGFLQNLPADVRYLGGAGMDTPIGLEPPSAPVPRPRAAAAAPAPVPAVGVPALTVAGDHLTGAGNALLAAASALLRAATKLALPMPGSAAGGPGAVTDNAYTAGSRGGHPHGGIPIPVGAGYFDPDKTVPVGQSIDPVTGMPSGAKYYRRRPNAGASGPPVAGTIDPGLGIDPFGGIVGGNASAFRNPRNRSGKLDLGVFPAALKGSFEGLRRLEAGLATIGHVGMLAFNRIGATVRGFERQMGRVAISARPLTASLGLAFRAVTFPITFAARALGLWDTRAGHATNTLRIMGRVAGGLTAPLTVPFKLATGAASAFGSVLRTVLQTSVAFATTAFIGMAVKGVRASADLAESVNAVKTVFKGSASAVTDFAQGMADKFGIVKKDVLDASTRIGGTFKANGLGTRDSAEMSNKLTQRAADITSQRNPSGGIGEVMGAIDSAISGRSSEPLSRFGVALDEDRIKAKALAMGLAQTAEAVGRTARARAAYALIMEQSKDAENDLLNTGTSTKNLMRDLAGRFENASAALGSKLEPAFTEMLLLLQEIFVGSKKATTAVHDWVGGVVEGVVEAIRFVRRMWENWDTGVEFATVLVEQWAENFADRFQWIGEVVSKFLGWFTTNWKTIFADAFEFIATALANLGKNFLDFGKSVIDWFNGMGAKPFEFKMTPILEGKAATITPKFELPELKLRNSFEKTLGDLWKKIAGTDVRLPTKDANRKPVDEDGNPIDGKGKKDKKDSAGELIGARELLAMMQKSVFDKDSKQLENVARNGREQVAILREIRNKRPMAVMG